MSGGVGNGAGGREQVGSGGRRGEGLGGWRVCFGISGFCEFASLHAIVVAMAGRAGVR